MRRAWRHSTAIVCTVCRQGPAANDFVFALEVNRTRKLADEWTFQLEQCFVSVGPLEVAARSGSARFQPSAVGSMRAHKQ